MLSRTSRSCVLPFPRLSSFRLSFFWLISTLNHFQVLIVPHHLDYIELTPIPNRRTAWTHDGTSHEWKEEILVP